MRDGFGFRINEEFVGIAAAGFAIERGAPLAEDFLEFFLGVRGKLFHGFDAEGAKSAFGDFADTRNLADGKRGEEARFHARSDPDETAGFTLIGGDFGSEASGGEAARTRQAGLSCDGAKEFVGGGEWRAVEAFGTGEIEVGFVNGDHFDDGRKFREDGGDAIAPFGIFFVVPIEEDGVGTKAACGPERHRGMDPEFTRFVAGGRNDAALIRAAANDHRLATEIGALEEFDGDEEGVHIHVEDRGVEWGLGGVQGSGVMLGAEASQVGHAVSLACRARRFNEKSTSFDSWAR